MIELNKIYNESNLETMAKMPDNFIDLVVTSPPYDDLRTYKDKIDESWGEHIWKPIIKELYRTIKEGGVVVWVVGDAVINASESGTSFKQALYAIDCGFKLHDTMIYAKKGCPFPESNRYNQKFEYMFIWSKQKPKTVNLLKQKTLYKSSEIGKNRKTTTRKADGTMEEMKYETNKQYTTRYNIWEYAVGNNKSTKDSLAFKHPATYPEKLVSDHIHSWSNEGDLVYDPFMGSGTTAKMAHIYKRNWIGSEMSNEYVEIANKRLKPYLNQTTLF